MKLIWLFYFIAGDGVFSSTDHDGNISLVDLRTNTSKILVERADVKDVSLPTHWPKRTSPFYRVAACLAILIFGEMAVATFQSVLTTIYFSRSTEHLSHGVNGSSPPT